MSSTSITSPETLQWIGENDGHLRLIDQTLLPNELKHIDCNDKETVWEAIKMLRVRGAPAIGIAAAYGFVIGLREDADDVAKQATTVADYLATSRPTAVNLFWALARMKKVFDSVSDQSFDLLGVGNRIASGNRCGPRC